jgi:hypothetical protein
LKEKGIPVSVLGQAEQYAIGITALFQGSVTEPAFPFIGIQKGQA